MMRVRKRLGAESTLPHLMQSTVLCGLCPIHKGMYLVGMDLLMVEPVSICRYDTSGNFGRQAKNMDEYWSTATKNEPEDPDDAEAFVAHMRGY